MNLEQVEVILHADGRVEIKVLGINGEECLAITEPLESALGAVVLSRELTGEYYSPPESTPTANHLQLRKSDGNRN